jgi:peptidoglycan hydrolase-like protein with peptidoglycan-binding domain
MKKLIITEEEKNHIRNLHEQKRKLSAKQLGISVDNTSNTTMPSSTTTYGLTPQTSTYVPETNPENKTENLNPKNLKVGDGGKNNPQKKNDVIELQNKLISLGCLKTDTGKATGYFGSKTDAALKLYQTKGSCKAVNTAPKKEEQTSGGFKSYFRKYFPNLTQLFFARNLSTSDFTENQKKVLFNVILSAIKRGQNPQKGSTEYEDYGDDIKSELDTKQGASTLKTLTGSFLPDDRFKMATTIGRFSYRMTKDGTYLVTDNYDFSKGTDYDKVKSGELKNKSYIEKLGYVMYNNGWSPYRAARFLAWIENPQNTMDKDKIKINVELNPQELAQVQKISTDSNLV